MTITEIEISNSAEQLTVWGARLDQAVTSIQHLDPEARAVAEEFALALDALSRTALTTMVRRLKEDEQGKALLFELVDDPSVRFLLGMHGIIRMPDPEQAEQVRTGAGADGVAPGQGHGSGGGKPQTAFISLQSLLRGPQKEHACGCDGGNGCVCGGH